MSTPVKRGLPLPGALWVAFARANAWKGWALAVALVLNVILALGLIGAVRRPPEVVLVQPDGASHFVGRGVSDQQLARWLEQQSQEPLEVEQRAFGDRFLQALLALDSATAEETWAEALGMMAPGLRAAAAQEAQRARTIEKLHAASAHVSVRVSWDDVIERSGEKRLLRAKLTRTTTVLASEGRRVTFDRARVDLVLRVIPRSATAPSGLEALLFSIKSDYPDAGVEEAIHAP